LENPLTFLPETQYDEGDDLGATPTGELVLGRDPTGKAAPFQLDNTGAVKVTGGGGGSSATAAKQDTGNASLASIDGKLANPMPVSGPLTDTQLRATPIPVAGPVTDAQLRASAVPVSAAALPLPAGAATEATLSAVGAAVSALTHPSDTQLVSAAALPLPTGASTEATLAAIKAKTDNLDVALSTRTKPADTQPISAASLPLPTGAATSSAQTTAQTSLGNIDTGIGTDGATPPSIPGTGVRGWMRALYDKIVLLVAVFPATLDTNSGNKSASTLRIVFATDQPTNTNKWAVTSTSDGSAHGTSDLAADDVIKWAGTTISVPVATAPDGTQTSPVIRNLNRKGTTIETTTPLAANALFTGAWHDTNLTGDNYVTAFAFSDKIGATYTIEESDDNTDANFTRVTASWNGALPANTLGYMIGVVRARFWRVKFTNGATLQTTFKLTACASSVAPDTIITNNTSGSNSFQSKVVQIVQPGGAGGGSDNLALFMTWQAQNGASQGPQDVLTRVHGGKWSGTAAGTKSGASMARTPTQFKQATATASGDTAVWTPLTGNKFRLLKFKLQLTADAIQASGGRITILLRDATTDIGVGHVVYVPAAGATALNAGWQSEWIDLGQFGYLSTAANAVLNVNLSAALTAGVCNVIAAGTEE
jgi:hypothetical protein